MHSFNAVVPNLGQTYPWDGMGGGELGMHKNNICNDRKHKKQSCTDFAYKERLKRKSNRLLAEIKKKH